LPLRHNPDQLTGLPIELLLVFVHAEGCGEIDLPGSTLALGDHPLDPDVGPVGVHQRVGFDETVLHPL
jgi:hypothetical protein